MVEAIKNILDFCIKIWPLWILAAVSIFIKWKWKV